MNFRRSRIVVTLVVSATVTGLRYAPALAQEAPSPGSRATTRPAAEVLARIAVERRSEGGNE